MQVLNEESVNKWKEEILSSGFDVTKSVMDWIIKELQYKALAAEDSRIYAIYNGDAVKSDAAVSDAPSDSPKRAIQSPENVKEKDWHPGSDGHTRICTIY